MIGLLGFIIGGLIVGAVVAGISGYVQYRYQQEAIDMQEQQIKEQEARARLQARQTEWQTRKAAAASLKQAGAGLMAMQASLHDAQELNKTRADRTKIFGPADPMHGVDAVERGHQEVVDTRTRHFGGTPVTNA